MTKEKQGNSIAIWSEDENGNNIANFQVDLDVNIWISKEESENYIEFGITTPPPRNAPPKFSVMVFLPYLTDKNDFEDKGKFLVDNHETLAALFNEEVAVNSSPNQFTRVTLNNSQYFYMFKPSTTSDVNFNKDESGFGTKICINIEPNGTVDAGSPIYTRFRINSLGALFSKQANKSYFLSSKKEIDLYIDFKVNSPRSLPEKITTKMQAQKFGRIKFFLLTESDKNIIYNTGSLHKTRLLEKHIWDEYLIVNRGAGKVNRSDDKKIAYHWNHKFSEDKDQDYSLFVKMSYASTNWKTIIIALVVIFLMSVLSNCASDQANKIFQKSFSSNGTQAEATEPNKSAIPNNPN